MPSYSRQELIDYMLEYQEAALEGELVGPTEAGPPSPDAQREIDRRRAAREAELESLPLRDLLMNYDKVLRDEQKLIVEEDADYDRWVRMDGWSRDEMTALLLRRCPDLIEDAELEEPFCAGPYWDLQRRIYRAQKMGILGKHITPAKAVQWAKERDIDCPAKLREALARFRPPLNGLTTEVDRGTSSPDPLSTEAASSASPSSSDSDRGSLSNDISAVSTLPESTARDFKRQLAREALLAALSRQSADEARILRSPEYAKRVVAKHQEQKGLDPDAISERTIRRAQKELRERK